MKLFLALTLLSFTALNAQSSEHELNGLSSFGLLENKGQVVDSEGNTRSDILFTTENQGMKVFIGKTGFHYQFSRPLNQDLLDEELTEDNLFEKERIEDLRFETYRVDIELIGANPSPKLICEDVLGYYENFYLPHCPKGITGVQSFRKVILKEVYPGIDWIFYRNLKNLKYDFLVHPGADPSQIKLKFNGASDIKIKEDGSLFVETPLGYIHEQAPISFAGTKPVQSSFCLNQSVVTFNVEKYLDQSLRIDPVISWGTYYGSIDREEGKDCATDLNDNVYLTGFTYSTTSISSGGHQNTINGSSDVFLVKFDSTGSRLWGTYYGGSGVDNGYVCTTDDSGNVYVAGRTESPTGMGVGGHQALAGSNLDAFLVKFNSAGLRLWGTYYGSTGYDRGYGCSTDKNGNVYLCGETSGGLNTTPGTGQGSFGGAWDAFLVKFNSLGTLQWANYFGGSGTDQGYDVAVDTALNVYLTGKTNSLNNIDSLAYQDSIGGSYDGFLVKYDQNGLIEWSTYIGGAGLDFGLSCSVDDSSHVFVAGIVGFQSFFSHKGFKDTIEGIRDVFVSKYWSSGVLEWCTYFGGNGDEGAPGFYSPPKIMAIGKNAIFISGTTDSQNNLASGGPQNLPGFIPFGQDDGFIAKLNKRGQRIWATYFGSGSEEIGHGCAVDSKGNSYLCGTATHRNRQPLVLSGGFKSTLPTSGLFGDAYLIKYSGCTTVSSFINVTTCNNYLWPISNKSYTKSGVYIQNILTSTNCDSAIYLNLQIERDTTVQQIIKACNNFRWSADSVIYSQGGKYLAQLKSKVGCDSVVELTLDIVTMDTSISKAGSEIAANLAGVNYQWLDCNNGHAPINGATQQQFTPLVNGSYAVQLTDTNCTDTSACYFVTDVSLNEFTKNVGLQIYPNPTKEIVTIYFSDLKNSFSYRLRNSIGQTILSGSKENILEFELMIPGSPGLYFLQIETTTQEPQSFKILKK